MQIYTISTQNGKNPQIHAPWPLMRTPVHGSHNPARFPSQETKTRHNRKDIRTQGSFDLTPVHRHITSKTLQEGFACTGVIWRDSGARTCGPEHHTRHKDVHWDCAKQLRYTNMSPQRLSKRDACAQRLPDLTPVHSHAVLSPKQGTKMCTEIKQNDSHGLIINFNHIKKMHMNIKYRNISRFFFIICISFQIKVRDSKSKNERNYAF